MVEQLFFIGEKVFDINFVMALLRSLLKSYQTLIVIVETRPPIELTNINGHSSTIITRVLWQEFGINLQGDIGNRRKKIQVIFLYSYSCRVYT